MPLIAKGMPVAEAIGGTEEIKADERNVMTEALDAARTATRAGATRVTVISLESR